MKDGPALTRARMLLFAFAAGAMIANIYYIQPLLPVIAGEFGQDPSRIGYLVTCTQLGYAFGVLLIVPLGDTVDPRRLLTGLLAFNAAASFLAALSQDFSSFAAASMLIGLSSAATMVLVPYVASLAPAESRGEKVGQMMTGALLGILLAWTIAGLVAELAGWRVMYWVASAVVTLLLVAIRQAVPTGPGPSSAARYRVLIASLLEIARRHEELRWRSFYSALGMASFSAMWTALPMLLSGSPYHLSSATIGFFGLTGTAGALASTLIGRLGDRGLAQRMTVVLSLVLVAAWLVAGRGEHGVPAVILASVLLNIGVMGLQVTHQSVIYGLDPNARSRITAVFITSGFLGASLGSATASAAYKIAGWKGVCLIGGALPVLLLVSWAYRRLRASAQIRI